CFCVQHASEIAFLLDQYSVDALSNVDARLAESFEQTARASTLARLQCFRGKALLHQDVDIKLISLLESRAVRGAQLQTARTRTHCFPQRQRLFNIFAGISKVAALLLRSRDAFERGCRAAQVVDLAKCREGWDEVFEGFLGLAQRDVNLAEIGQREGFMTS